MWKADARDPEVKSQDLPIAFTQVPGNTDIDSCNANRFEEFGQRHAHLQRLVQHEVILKEASDARPEEGTATFFLFFK